MNYLYYSVGFVGGCLSIFHIYKFTKNKFYKYIFEQVNKELDQRMEKEEGFTPMRKTTSAMLKINHGGKSHSIYIPYDRKKSIKMMKCKVFLYKDVEKIDITQKPGVPYLVSASDLGGEKIVVENKEGKELYTYLNKNIPDCF